MEYNGLTLDDFQEQAVRALMDNKSVIVSAPTGSGKTLIADCIIDIELQKGKKVVYTAPIKALSNQKYKDFTQRFGHRQVGIMTGDVVINAGAPLLIMTTEIYRNMLLVKDPMVQDISYVILDEVHFINDIERGTVWEESLIFSPAHVRFCALSATIPNAKELADWIGTIQPHEVLVIKHHHRPVPLKHMFYDIDKGMTTLDEIRKLKKLDKMHRYSNKGRKRDRQEKFPAPQHWMLVKELAQKGLVPCIYFVFSRHETQRKAGWVAKKNNYLSKEEASEVASEIHEYFLKIDPQINQLHTTQLLKQCLSKGVAFHHAGLLPNHKEMVEILFGKGLVKVLYATETFAVGINMPAKTVCFDSLEKYDGRTFRYLNSKEYFQLAGRAGRRGIDKHGLAVSLINRKFSDLDKIAEFTKADTLPIKSQFKLSYNTVLNMTGHFDDEQVEVLLKSNLGFFQAKGKKGFDDPMSVAKIKRSFIKKKKTLERFGYIEDGRLTEKGQFATYIYANELVLTECFYGDFHQDLDEFQIILLVAGIIYEPRRAHKFEKSPKVKEAGELIVKISKDEEIAKRIDMDNLKMLVGVMHEWVNGISFIELLELSNLLEGDLIRLFRQIIDTLSQIRKASHDHVLNAKIDNAIRIIDREFVAVSFD